MYINRSGIEPPICVYFILLFLIFLSISVQRIEGKSLGFDPTHRERRCRLFTPRNTAANCVTYSTCVRVRTCTCIYIYINTIVRPINAVYIRNESRKKDRATRREIHETSRFMARVRVTATGSRQMPRDLSIFRR